MQKFNEKVYLLCKKIPKGKISTYKLIAEKLGTNAYRAVGQALKHNPNSPKVPCHRIVCSDGSLGGFFGNKNSNQKIRLLNKEGIKIHNYKIINFKEKLFDFDNSWF